MAVFIYAIYKITNQYSIYIVLQFLMCIVLFQPIKPGIKYNYDLKMFLSHSFSISLSVGSSIIKTIGCTFRTRYIILHEQETLDLQKQRTQP